MSGVGDRSRSEKLENATEGSAKIVRRQVEVSKGQQPTELSELLFPLRLMGRGLHRSRW